MRFKHKVLLLPVLAAVFLVAIIGFSELLGRSTREHLQRIEKGYVPAVLLSRDLDDLLQQLQRTLQDAVAAEDTEQLDEADALVERFLARVAEGRANTVIEAARLDALEAQVRDYARIARETSARMIQKDPDAASRLPEMSARYTRVKEALQRGTEDDQRKMGESFVFMMEEHGNSQKRMVLLGALLIAVLASLSVWLVAQVARPLGRLTEVASRIATDGDLTQEISIPSRDEVGMLAQSFNQLVLRLRTIPLTLQESLKELAGSVERLTHISREQSQHLTRQAASLEEATLAMRDIESSSRSASSQAGTVLEVASRAESLSVAGQARLKESGVALEHLRAQVGGLMPTIGQLTESSAKAAAIIQTVKDLADQSNVLAINAAIEAARSGDQGRGFSVVAREMRSLAQQSMRSTQSIGALLSEMAATVRAVTTSVETSHREMAAGISEALASGQSLQGMAEAVQHSSQAAQDIVTSVTRQNAGITQMTAVVTDFSKMMKDSVQTNQDVESAIDRLNVAFARIQGLVGGFRV
ncbi:methyl-accepting chemotaxis protein [Pyxidicoccus fallax]|uniref:Methyl-accepting chemotaxis protein n=1 Tax=Pyxidicoccus fallax TaxID=394095 RepID=A0A848LM64_9BACT|nr:methyl-accepting chemotaxis protein [Pyxidicoccus fallax]NMO18868.1 methyl-accepting chemotaxis protein [Pyxidicoccus fallax]NPC80513.1 methyl-accepting chemotaxis protein [Pyxidicoccus fallax]